MDKLPYEYIRLELQKPDNSFAPYEAFCKIDVGTVRELTKDEIIVGIGLSLNGKPVGAATAIFNKVLKFAEVRSFFILPEHDHPDVGVTLMANLLDELKHKHANYCKFLYLKEDPNTSSLEQILLKTQWKGPQLIALRYYFTHDFNPDWIYAPYRYPKGYEEFLWKNLTEKDRREVARMEEQNYFENAISPFRDENILEPLNSLGLRKNGKIVAWILTHRIDVNTIRYSSFYVERPLRDRILTSKLLANSILLHKNSPVPTALVEIPLLVVHPHWVQFVKKRLEPYADKITHLLQAWIPLE